MHFSHHTTSRYIQPHPNSPKYLMNPFLPPIRRRPNPFLRNRILSAQPFPVKSVDKPIIKSYIQISEKSVDKRGKEGVAYCHKPFYSHYEREYCDRNPGKRDSRSSRRQLHRVCQVSRAYSANGRYRRLRRALLRSGRFFAGPLCL